MFEKFLDKIDKLDEDENKKGKKDKEPQDKEPQDKEPQDKSNAVSFLIEIVAIVMAFIGILTGLGIIFFANDIFWLGIIILFASLVMALFIKALAEIIDLLQEISNKLDKK